MPGAEPGIRILNSNQKQWPPNGFQGLLYLWKPHIRMAYLTRHAAEVTAILFCLKILSSRHIRNSHTLGSVPIMCPVFGSVRPFEFGYVEQKTEASADTSELSLIQLPSLVDGI